MAITVEDIIELEKVINESVIKSGKAIVSLTIDRFADDEIAKPKTSGNTGRVRKITESVGSAVTVASYEQQVKNSLEKKAKEYEQVGDTASAETLRLSAVNFKAEIPKGKTPHPSGCKLLMRSEKTGETLLRVFNKGANKSKVQYLLDGKPTTGKELLESGIVTPSSQAPKESKKQGSALLDPDEQIGIFTVALSNVKHIGCGTFQRG